jgi:hypothetical protein
VKYFEEMPGEGGLIASYKGQGRLTLDGGAEYPCEFELEHHPELGVLMECDFRGTIPSLGRSFQSFTGTTDDGQFTVESVGPADYRSANFNAGEGESNATVFWHLRGVKLERLDNPRPARVHYGLTNFEFRGVDAATGFEDLLLTLRDGDNAVEVVIRPVNDYKRICKFISLYRSVRVTCEARVDLAGNEFETTIDGVIGSLCNVASVARGTRIVWVYRHAYDYENRLAAMYHLSP